MTTGSTLIIYSLCVWTVIPCLVFFIYKKRNPSKKPSPLNTPITLIRSTEEDKEDEEDPRSLSQLQIERQRLLSSRRKAALLHQNLEISLRNEKAPASIALAITLKSWRFKLQRISLLQNRLTMNEVDMQHLNAELQHIETILASMQAEKKPAKQAKQAQRQGEKEGITPRQALFNKNFLASLKEAFAKRTPQELGFSIQPEDKAVESFSKEDRLNAEVEKKILDAKELEDHLNAEVEKKILSGILTRRPKRSKNDLDRSYVIEEEQHPDSNLLLPTSASSLVQWEEVSWEEVSDEEKEIPCAEENENEFPNDEEFLDIEKLDGFQNKINIKRLR